MRWLLVALVLVGCNGGNGAQNACSGLSLMECRLTDGCKPDTCFACLCNQTYRGCIPANQTPTACPALGCAGAECCGTQSQCSQADWTCVPPTGAGAPGCGVCNTQAGDCTDDSQCKTRGASLVCDPIACTCSDQKTCVQGCTNDTPCTPLGQVCDLATARCVAKSCTNATDCGPNFDCTTGACVRRPCSSDLPCDGYCVEGQCYDQTGTCTPPAA